MIARRLLLAAGAALPMVAQGQTPRPPGRIGYLHPRTADPNHFTLVAMRSIWQRLGYVENESVLTRAANSDLARLPSLARELAAAGAGVLVVVGPAAVRAAAEAVPHLPIVAIDLETDPVRAGFARSYARPGGMVTGLFVDQPSLVTKWIALLREAVPATERIAVLWDPSAAGDQLDTAVATTQQMDIATTMHSARTAEEIEAVFDGFGDTRGLGVVTLGSPGFGVVARQFSAAAIGRRVPSVSFLRLYAEAGVLITYGPDQAAYFPRAIVLADRILRGEKPGDVPIERPHRFELVVNVRTAAAIGIDLPPMFLAQCDEVIE